MKDPIVEEVRKHRMVHSRCFLVLMLEAVAEHIFLTMQMQEKNQKEVAAVGGRSRLARIWLNQFESK